MKIRNFLLLAVLIFTVAALVQGTKSAAAVSAPPAQQSQQLAGESPALVTLVKAGKLLDPRTGNVLSPAAVLIEDGKIKEVGSPSRVQADAPAGVKTIDLGSATLLPGLIDSHTHLLLDVTVPTEEESTRRYNSDFATALLLAITMSPSERVLRGAQLAREDLESGFTTVRNLGHSGIDGDTVLRDAINAGRVPGPRLLASGRKLTALGSYMRSLNPALAEPILQQEFLGMAVPTKRGRRCVRTSSTMLTSSRFQSTTTSHKRK